MTQRINVTLLHHSLIFPLDLFFIWSLVETLSPSIFFSSSLTPPFLCCLHISLPPWGQGSNDWASSPISIHHKARHGKCLLFLEQSQSRHYSFIKARSTQKNVSNTTTLSKCCALIHLTGHYFSRPLGFVCALWGSRMVLWSKRLFVSLLYQQASNSRSGHWLIIIIIKTVGLSGVKRTEKPDVKMM